MIDTPNPLPETIAPAAVPKKHSGMGIASFIMSIGAGLATFFVFVIAGIMQANTPGGLNEKSTAAMIVGFGIMGLLFLDLVAIGLGVGGLLEKEKKKLFAALGTIFSSVIAVGTLGLIILGLIMKKP